MSGRKKSQKDVIEAVLEELKRREIALYLQKQSVLEKIFQRANDEDWLSDISESRSGKRFLLELAVKASDVVVERMLPEKIDMKVEAEVLQVIADLRKVLTEENKEKVERKCK